MATIGKTGILPGDLRMALDMVYFPHGLKCSRPVAEPESGEYGAHRFEMNGEGVCFRIAKITPTKIGQFVVLWKRTGEGPIQPFDTADGVEFVIISTRMGDRVGQFVFPKSVMADRGVMSENGAGGKRAFRVYPPWDTPNSRQAKQTQQWQLSWFLDLPHGGPIDPVRLRRLFSKRSL